MTRRGGLGGLLLLALAAGACAPRPAPQPRLAASRPNILFILADDHAAHAISAYGSKLARTPNLDRIAREGLRFERCFVTNSICAPCRASFLTGTYNHVNGQLTNRERFDPRQPTFPALLRAAGYETALIGKWHLKSRPAGFDHYEILAGQGGYFDPVFASEEGRRRARGYTTDLITERALAWLARRDGSKPFCLLVWHKAPHRDWRPAPRHLRAFRDAALPEPEDLFDDWRGLGPAARMQEMTLARDLDEIDLKLELPEDLPPRVRAAYERAYAAENARFPALRGPARLRWIYRRYVSDYLRCVLALDEGVGRLLDALERRGLRDRTLVVYSSDQGFFLGDHGWYDKRWMYEESIRIPFLVSWPGHVPAGGSVRALALHLDLAPTLLELAGVPLPARMQGRSLVPFLEGRHPPAWRRDFYYHYYEYPGWHSVRRHYGLRTERWKLIHYYGLGAWELFDLLHDPGEHRNLAGDPAHAVVFARLKARLARVRRELRVPPDRRPIPPYHPRRGPRPKGVRGGAPHR